MMKKSTIIFIIVVLMLIAICVFAFMGNKGSKTKESLKKNTNEQAQNNTDEIANEMANEIIEETVLNEIDNNEINTNEIENNEPTETFKEEPKTAEEKAIAIVKADWNDESAQYSIQGMDNNGNYIVTVTDGNTTESLAFYSVNVNNSTFNKREIN